MEHHAHFLYCPQPEAVEYRNIRRKVLINQMAKLNTCPAIILMVARILSHEGSNDFDHNITVSSRVELFLSIAMSEQFKIGYTRLSFQSFDDYPK